MRDVRHGHEVAGLMATKNQIKARLRKKKRAGLLPPPECPSCKADLRDYDVPADMKAYASLFGLAREIRVDAETLLWVCPVCSHMWGKHNRPGLPATPTGGRRG